MTLHPVVTVFGSSRPLPGDDSFSAAMELGRLLAVSGAQCAMVGMAESWRLQRREPNGGWDHDRHHHRGPRHAVAELLDRHRADGKHPHPADDALIELGEAYVVLKGGRVRCLSWRRYGS